LAGPEWEKQKEESALLAKRRFIRGRLIWISGPLLVLGGIGFVLYHWGIPWLQDAFPSVDTTTKAVVVIIVACLIFPFVLFWLLFPLLLLFQMVKTNELLAKLVAAQSWDPDEDELDADEDDEEE